MPTRLRAAVFSSLLLASRAPADVFYVDDGGGPNVDFSDLPPAVAAALPGDVIVVFPGQYSSTVLSEGIRILGLGSGAARIHGLRIELLPAKQVAAVVNAQIYELVVEDCQGTVVIDDVWMHREPPFGPDPGALVVDSADVRMFRSLVTADSLHDSAPALVVQNSRIELVETSCSGWSGSDAPCFVEDGQPAVELQLGARGLIADPVYVYGGFGGSLTQNCSMCNPPQNSGDGAPAILVGAACSLTLTGDSGGPSVQGGIPGTSTNPSCEGSCGPAIRAHATAQVRWAGVTLDHGWSCDPGSAVIEGPATQVPSIPYMTLQWSQEPGAPARFAVFGEPGDTVDLVLGAQPILQPTPGVDIERLTTEDRRIHMGTIAPNGNVSVLLPLPLGSFAGAALYAQAVVSTASGLVRTNSQVVIAR